MCINALLKCTAAACEEVVCPAGMEAVEEVTHTEGVCQRPMCPLRYRVRYSCAEKIFGSSRTCYCPAGTVESNVSLWGPANLSNVVIGGGRGERWG